MPPEKDTNVRITCDGEDNDCNDTIDDVCGVGESCIPGIQSCVNGAWTACTGKIIPFTETCDGKDNDCDGTVDDGWGNICDNAPNKYNYNPSQADDDCDGIPGACDNCPFDDKEKKQ